MSSCSKDNNDTKETNSDYASLAGTSWTCETHVYENETNDKIRNLTLEFIDETTTVFTIVENGIWEGNQLINRTRSSNWAYTFNSNNNTGIIYDPNRPQDVPDEWEEFPFSLNGNQLAATIYEEQLVFQKR